MYMHNMNGNCNKGEKAMFKYLFNSDYRNAKSAYRWWMKNGVRPTIVRDVDFADYTTYSCRRHEMVQLGNTKFYFPYNMRKGGVFHNLYRVVSKNGNDYVIHRT
tara:strand:- start:2230 stop:2541 length:312 start_codon:yes stop_codon:yes gene_type:complete